MRVSLSTTFERKGESRGFLCHRKTTIIPKSCAASSRQRISLSKHFFFFAGSELQVLKTIPFDKVDIRVLTVEFSHTIEGADALEDFMEEQGYVTSMQITHPRGFAADIVFIKKY